jgi:hypothetical protein
MHYFHVEIMQLLLSTSLCDYALGVCLCVCLCFRWLVVGGRSLYLLGTITSCVLNLYYFPFGWLYMR